LDDLKEARRYWKLKEEAQDLTPWRTTLFENKVLWRDLYIIRYYFKRKEYFVYFRVSKKNFLNN
jgi:hypothetical protein